MKSPTEKQAAGEIVDLLGDLFGASPKAIRLRPVGAKKRYDYAISVPGQRFMAEYKSNAAAGSVSAAIDGLRRCADDDKSAGLPLLVVPFMGQVGQQLCDRFKVSWLDLSGNAKIVAPGIRIWIEGRPNKYSERGRPPNIFAPKSSRITRQLLLHPRQFQTQVDLARQTDLDDGYVSKIVRRLEAEQYLNTNEEGGVRPRDPDLLLDAWHDAYDFTRHRVIQGHVPARSGDEVVRRVVAAMSGGQPQWAVTGLSAAWLYTNFAAFRLTTVYLSSLPSRPLLKELEFSDETQGANLWVVLPDDDGVFHGSQVQAGIPCVSPLQAYLDLKGQPERAKDAAIELRRRLLHWGQRGT
jgi:hypothetical protein